MGKPVRKSREAVKAELLELAERRIEEVLKTSAEKLGE